MVECSERQKGFTLIELILSLALMGLVLGVLGTATRIIANGWDRHNEMVSMQDMLLRGLHILRRDVEGIERQIEFRDKVPGFVFDGAQDELRFVVIEPPYPTRSGPYLVHYWVKRRSGKAILFRSRVPYYRNRVSPTATGKSDVAPLLEGPFQYRFSFRDGSAQGNGWSKTWPDKSRLPGLIRLAILDAKSGAPVLPPVIIRLRHDAERGCLAKRALNCTLKSDGVLQAPAENKHDNRGQRS